MVMAVALAGRGRPMISQLVQVHKSVSLQRRHCGGVGFVSKLDSGMGSNMVDAVVYVLELSYGNGEVLRKSFCWGDTLECGERGSACVSLVPIYRGIHSDSHIVLRVYGWEMPKVRVFTIPPKEMTSGPRALAGAGKVVVVSRMSSESRYGCDRHGERGVKT
jgi:hypothetical protein